VQILSAEQIKQWDRYTIEHEPISSIDLMERAAGKCVEWIQSKNWQRNTFHIFCGKGNNGGDGLVIARQLLQDGYNIRVYILEPGTKGSPDFQINLQRLHDLGFKDIYLLQSSDQFPSIGIDELIVDALFGSGLNKALDGLAQQVVEHINKCKTTIISIDLPSGLFMDRSSMTTTVVRATYTLTFQCLKLGLLMQENAALIGEVHVLDIGLDQNYLSEVNSRYELIDEELIRCVYKPRSPFAHKGVYGHALLIGGSYGKMGAIQLATKACLRAGAGLTTAFIPACGYDIIQTSLPEAMVIVDKEEKHLSGLPDDIEKYSAIGVGPGMGTHAETMQLLSFIVRRYTKPVVIDADGLNCLAQQPRLLQQLPAHSILTPHPKEIERLFGSRANDFERMELAQAKAKELNCIIVLKSHHTLIALPGGMCYFNSTGNAGLSKGGSGDVLTGILSAMLAQGYSPAQAAILGVYLHGLAADIALQKFSKESLLAGDVVEYFSKAFKFIGTTLP